MVWCDGDAVTAQLASSDERRRVECEVQWLLGDQTALDEMRSDHIGAHGGHDTVNVNACQSVGASAR